jgi:PAS domain S-box-containing protein
MEDQRVRDLAEALSRSEERYRAILDDQNDMVTRSLPDGTLTYVNPATCRILGLSAEQLNGRNWHDFIPSAEALRSVVERLDALGANQASVVNDDTPVRTASGETRWFAWENRAVFDRQGRVSEISAVGRDVTDRRRTEQALRESQTTLQSFYDGTPLLMGLAEIAGEEVIVVHANAALGQFLGVPPEEIAGRTFASFGTPPQIQALWLGYFEQSRREGRGARFNYLRSRASGEHSYCATVNFLGGDERPRFSFVVEDETARRDVERKLACHSDLLRESEGRLATVFREAPVGITISRLSDGVFLDVNPAFCSLFGYAREEILGNTPNGLKITQDTTYRDRMLAELAIRESVNGRFTSLRTRAGDERECLASYGRIRLEGQDCLVTILQDVTQRRRAEQRLEQALAEREVLLREIHHRVKNNLQLLSSLMSFELARGPGAEVRQVAESLGRRIHAMAGVHEHLYGAHDLSSLQADVYLGDLLRANLAAHGDAAARLTVSVQVAPLALSLETALRVGLIVSELTSNALRHGFADNRDGTLTLRLARLGSHGFELVISDDGIGLGAADSDESQSATLGLRLVKQIARQLAGDLFCVTQPGTTWTLRVAAVT